MTAGIFDTEVGVRNSCAYAKQTLSNVGRFCDHNNSRTTL